MTSLHDRSTYAPTTARRTSDSALYERALREWNASAHLVLAFADFDHFLEGVYVAHRAAIDGCLDDVTAWQNTVAERTSEAVVRIRAARALSVPVGGAPAFERVGARLVVWLYGNIWSAPAIANAEVLCDAIDANADAAAVVVRIASTGGLALHGDRIAAALERHKGRTVAVVDKFAFSAATVVACACDRILMRADAAWMVHRTNTTVSGDAAALRRALSSLNCGDIGLANHYARKRRFGASFAREAMESAHFYSAIQAQAAGFVDQIIPPLSIDWGASTTEVLI